MEAFAKAEEVSAPRLRHPARPLHPYLVLGMAILLPGFGHVVCDRPRRGLTMQLFMISLAFITWHLTTPQHSTIGRLAGGLFVYALSLPEAYRLAKLRWAVFHQQAALAAGPS
jgi:hypothetical protein